MSAYDHVITPTDEQGDSIHVSAERGRIYVAIHRAHTTEAIRLNASGTAELIDALTAALGTAA